MFNEDPRMNSLPLLVYFILLLDSVFTLLPAPVNVRVSSINFQHVLQWDPGPGTPPGTQYRIIKRVNKKAKPTFSNGTSLKLKLPRYNVRYELTVEASYNQTLSPPSRKYFFTPFTDTTIGPPKVSLAGCGNCIKINISLPEPDRSSGIDDIQKLYAAMFKVLWRKDQESKVDSEQTSNRSFTVNNLQTGTRYCVQVHTVIIVNKNTEPSAWDCVFTSILEPSIDHAVPGALAAALILAIGVLTIFMFCLHYTGILCKLKASVPRGLIEAVNQGYTLTPETTICDKISISTEVAQQRKNNNPPTSQPATRGTNSDEEEEEEEEEEGRNVYIDRDAELSSAESSCQGSVDKSGNSKVAASEGSGCVKVETELPDTQFEDDVPFDGFDQDEAKAEEAEISLMPEGPVTCTVEEDQEEVCERSGNINLFSVTISALAVCEEEEEEEEEQNTGDSLTDFLKRSDLEPLLPKGSMPTLSITDSQTESDDQTPPVLMLPTQEGLTVNLYEAGCHKTCDGETQYEDMAEEEEEEEEELSGYMAHR
ncbi:cytokine receptor family member b1 [Centropristis striata]|uniref:cytokine receptor family member b1 n=1 Tax=Centropristis striata TaxID=184440 RepID=UPI0027DF8512|nr:cytokine receptor family member b1 [Centropristis striata]